MHAFCGWIGSGVAAVQRTHGPWLIAALMLALAAPAQAAPRIAVSAEKDNVVRIFDASGALLHTISVGARPRHLALSADARELFVACSDDDRIDVIDVATLKLLRSIHPGEDPELFAMSADGTLWVSNEDDATVTQLQQRDGKIVKTVAVGDEPEGVLVTPDGGTVYVTSEVANMVHVIDAASGEMRANILVGNRPRRFALTPDGKELWVTNELGGSVSVIDTASNQVKLTLPFEPKGFRPEFVTPVGIIMSRDGRHAYVSLGRSNHVAQVEVASHRVLGYVLTGQRAWGLALSADERTLYVANGLSDDVAVVALPAFKLERAMAAGRVPHSIVVLP